jgi:cytochrome c biogenesis protein CcdA
MAAGFVTVFGGFGILTVSAASTVQRYLPYVTVFIGIILVALGIWLLAGREITVLRGVARGARWAPTARLGSMFGYGISYAVASLSCTVGPFLAVTAAALRGGSVLGGVAVYFAYAAGFTLVVGVLAVAAALASSAAVDRMRRIVPYVNRISGALLLIVGVYVGYYGLYEIRLFTGNGNPEDSVIAAAGRVQGAIAGWVHQHGAWPWLVALAVLTTAALGAAWRASATAKYRRADRATAGDEP